MLLISYGTRPEYIKIKPLMNAFDKKGIDYRILFTGQHTTLIDGRKDRCITITEGAANRLDNIVTSICSNTLNAVFQEFSPEYVIVQGDTTSALAVALSAFHHKIKIAHLEAGLRSGDILDPYPEEANRKMISQIATLHLCPTVENASNLYRENIQGDIRITGNTCIDGLLAYTPSQSSSDIIIVTLHRRENIPLLEEWFKEINMLACRYKDYRFILPMHPNPDIRKHSAFLPDVEIVEPLPYSDLIRLLSNCKAVITDSGGLQEECSYFKKPCLVCRQTTERPEAVGITSKMVYRPSLLPGIFASCLVEPVVKDDCPFGDGHTAERIAEIFTQLTSEKN